MAVPHQLRAETPQLMVRSLAATGWAVPPGWYGLVEASAIGIIHQALVEQELGLDALEQMGAPEPESRSQEFDGRRLVRINGGYLVLNYARYREKDHTAGARQRAYRERHVRHAVTSRANAVTPRNVTQAEAEAEAEAEREGEGSAEGGTGASPLEAQAPPVPLAPSEPPAEDPELARLEASTRLVWGRFVELRARVARGSHPVLTVKRRQHIRARLRTYGEARVLAAVESMFRPGSWYVAEGRVQPEMVFRSDEQLEKHETGTPTAPLASARKVDPAETCRYRKAGREFNDDGRATDEECLVENRRVIANWERNNAPKRAAESK